MTYLNRGTGNKINCNCCVELPWNAGEDGTISSEMVDGKIKEVGPHQSLS
jgi:hypothetical protein